MKAQLNHIDSLKLEDYQYKTAIFSPYHEIFMDCCQYKELEVKMGYPTDTYAGDDNGFRLDEQKYPSVYRIVREYENYSEEKDDLDDEIERTNKLLFGDDEMPVKEPFYRDRLSLDELLKLEMYDFFDYCRNSDGVRDLYGSRANGKAYSSQSLKRSWKIRIYVPIRYRTSPSTTATNGPNYPTNCSTTHRRLTASWRLQ